MRRCLSIGTLASITANIAVAPDNLVARAISGWTAIALLAAAKMLSHLFEPNHTTQPITLDPAGAATLIDGTKDTDPVIDNQPAAVAARRRRSTDVARRLPTSDAALAKWRTIWDATKHLDTATPNSAATHAVSLRTLQFIRAAGEAGHLTGPTPASTLTEPNHHGTLTGALT